jgi:hypothetical protein
MILKIFSTEKVAKRGFDPKHCMPKISHWFSRKSPFFAAYW